MQFSGRISLLAGIVCFVLGACSNAEERADVGHDDGYAVGYNTACEIRATFVEGDFKNEHYAAAYAKGQSDGIMACQADRKAGKVE